MNALETFRRTGRVVREHLRWRRFKELAEPFILLQIDEMKQQPHPQSVVVISPHADDESIGCGGAIALHRLRGDTVHVVYTTDSAKPLMGGEPVPNQSEVRRQEAADAIEILGGGTLQYLGLTDGAAEITEDAIAQLRQTLSEHAPHRIYVPWKMDRHRDHVSAHTMLSRALQRIRLPDESAVWEYEVWTPLLPNRYIPIRDVLETKERAIRAHSSQVANTDFVRSSLGLAYYRGTQAGIKGPAEAYFAVPANKLALFEKL